MEEKYALEHTEISHNRVLTYTPMVYEFTDIMTHCVVLKSKKEKWLNSSTIPVNKTSFTLSEIISTESIN